MIGGDAKVAIHVPPLKPISLSGNRPAPPPFAEEDEDKYARAQRLITIERIWQNIQRVGRSAGDDGSERR